MRRTSRWFNNGMTISVSVNTNNTTQKGKNIMAKTTMDENALAQLEKDRKEEQEALDKKWNDKRAKLTDGERKNFVTILKDLDDSFLRLQTAGVPVNWKDADISSYVTNLGLK